MTNAYASLESIQASAVLNITTTAYNTRLRELLERVSRLIDRYCNRHFYVLVATRTFDGDGGTELEVPDLIAVTSLKTDDNKDRTFETTWAATDYLLYPINAEPTNAWGRPYSRVLVDSDAGSQDAFPAGRKMVQIDGKWGYREVTEDSGADINEGGAFSAADTTLTVTEGPKFQVGETILIGSEQLYITSISTNNLTVKRGVNGTTAVSHPDLTDISTFRHPPEVVEACLVQVSRMWQRRTAPPATFPFAAHVFQTLDQDVRQVLSGYRKPEVGGA